MKGIEEDTVYWLIRQRKMSIDDLERPEFQGCGLKMVVSIPTEYPDDFPEELTGEEACEKLREMTLEEAIRRWNRRD